MKKTLLMILLFSCLAASAQHTPANNADTPQRDERTQAELPVIEAELTFAPDVPKPTNRSTPAKVVVKLEALEKIMPIVGQTRFKYWTFNGATPGPFIRVREGDQVEVRLSNPANGRMPHSLDFHAASGPAGGAVASETLPGHTTTFMFKAVSPGLYVYHCGSEPVALHIGKGMFGLMLVEPKEGLPPADREFYIMQNEFYTSGEFGAKGMQVLDMNKANYELPDYVVFNGHVGALMDDTALKAKTGEKIRLYLGNAGPNLTSSFHIIGKTLDSVRVEGGSLENHHVQTVQIAPGSATIAEVTIQVPGTYSFIDHAIFRAMSKGATGQLIVEGEQNPEIFAGKIKDEPYDKRNPDADIPSGYRH